MLIEFSVGNYLSFKDKATLSMVAAKQLHAKDPQVDAHNTSPINDDLTLLVSAPIYGANASGKSNLVFAMWFMRAFVLQSSKESQSDEPIRVVPFQFSLETETAPSFFEIVFILNGLQYRYGFELTHKRVVAEWLFFVPTTKEARLFTRDEKGISISRKFKEGSKLETKTRANALFLSVVAQFNGSIAQTILKWFRQMGFVSGLDDEAYRDFTVSELAYGKHRQDIIQLVKRLDLGIDDLHTTVIEKSQARLSKDVLEKLQSQDVQLTAVKTKHLKWDANGQPIGEVVFELSDESEGTQKLFFLTGPILSSLAEGELLIIDELEARLHPLITCELVKLFQSPVTNPKHAQLIFTTHDTNLLSNKMFRRDQIWFVEKDRQGASHLYSLAELKVRNDASLENDYIQGRYGAIPFLGSIQTVVIKAE